MGLLCKVLVNTVPCMWCLLENVGLDSEKHVPHFVENESLWKERTKITHQQTEKAKGERERRRER